MAVVFKCTWQSLLELLAYAVNKSLAGITDNEEFDNSLIYTFEDMHFCMQVDEQQRNFVDLKEFQGRKIGLQIYEYEKANNFICWTIYPDYFDPLTTNISNIHTPLSFAQLKDSEAYTQTLTELPEVYNNIPYIMLRNLETDYCKLYKFENLSTALNVLKNHINNLEMSGLILDKKDTLSFTLDCFKMSVHLGSELKQYMAAQDIVNTFYYRYIENIRTEDLNVRIIT